VGERLSIFATLKEGDWTIFAVKEDDEPDDLWTTCLRSIPAMNDDALLGGAGFYFLRKSDDVAHGSPPISAASASKSSARSIAGRTSDATIRIV
jgi:hypothetical protein